MGDTRSSAPGSGARWPVASEQLHGTAPSGHHRTFPGQGRTSETLPDAFTSHTTATGNRLPNLCNRAGKLMHRPILLSVLCVSRRWRWRSLSVCAMAHKYNAPLICTLLLCPTYFIFSVEHFSSLPSLFSALSSIFFFCGAYSFSAEHVFSSRAYGSEETYLSEKKK